MKPEPEKAGEFGWNNLAYYADAATHRCLALKFPDHNAAVISRRGIGNLMFLDIDADGMLETIEKETGQKLARITFSVCSRPQSAPYKRHFYFRQTKYSVAKWRKENNVRDITKWVPDKNNNLIHPTLFDVKGVGGGGYVVAPGSVRASGEVYTVIDDLSVIDVPDWLIDWLAKQITAWNSAKRKEQLEYATKVGALSQSEQCALQKANDPSGFKYPASEIYPFMNWRAANLASHSVNKKYIQRQIIEEINRDFAGGRAYTTSDEGKAKIRGMVASKKLGTIHWDWVGSKKKAIFVGTKILAPQTRHSILVAAMQKFPSSISSSDGYQRLQEALIGTGFQLAKGPAAEKAVSQVRRAAGYSALRTRDGWIWVKDPYHSITTTHIV